MFRTSNKLITTIRGFRIKTIHKSTLVAPLIKSGCLELPPIKDDFLFDWSMLIVASGMLLFLIFNYGYKALVQW